jgi:D-arabinose 1-dehydrogenase-like Zn-dependent alcohol dehydrogenase
MNRVLATTGKGVFTETTYDVPPLAPDEICVRAVMTGVCRSDVDMMTGNFGPLPLSMQGHEGLGKVIGIGANIKDVEFGDYVATRGEPAYADCYNVRKNEYVRVPEAHPRYILEPVACGINVVMQSIREIAERSGPGRRLLIIGSGFLAWIAYNTLLLNHVDIDITVQGNSNVKLWNQAGMTLTTEVADTYDVIIDLGSSDSVFTKDIVNNEALIVFGAQKTVTTDFSNLLWKACTMIFPSPRTDKFYQCMKDAAMWVKNGDINIDSFWTKGYNRDTEWQQAFSDALTRPAGYSRGYIYWTNNGY